MQSYMFEYEFYFLLTIFFACFIIRALPRIFLPNSIASDTYFHLYRAQTIRDVGFRIAKKLPRVILPHENTYPFLYHYVLALFPDKHRMFAERLTGAFFDTISTLLVYLFSSWLVEHDRQFSEYSHLPLIVTICFAFSPAMLRIGSGPRAYNGSPRTMGQTLYLAHLFAAFIALESSSLVMAATSILSGALLIVTAKFAVQVLVFFGSFFIFFLSASYAAYLAMAFLFSILITRGAAITVLKGQVKHSINYVKHLQKIFLHPNVISFKDYILRCLKAPYYVLSLQPVRALSWFFAENYPLHLLLFVFPQFLFVPYKFSGYGSIGMGEKALLVWAVAGLFWFVLTKMRLLMFLGEGERYLEYSLFPSFFITVTFFWQHQVVLHFWIGYSLLSAIYYIYEYLRYYKANNLRFHSIHNCLHNFIVDKKAVVWPIGSHHFEALFHSKNSILTHGANIDGDLFNIDDFMLIYGNYPYPSKNWRDIINKYAVSYIYCDKIALDYYKNVILEDTEIFEKCLEKVCNSDIGLWKIVKF